MAIRCIVLFFGLSLTWSARAQGTVVFQTVQPDPGPTAMVSDRQTGARLAGTNYFAQLYAGPAQTPEENLRPVVGPPLTFRTGLGAGVFFSEGDATRIVDGVPAGQVANLQVRVWTANSGATYEEAVATAAATRDARHRFGSSMVFSETLGGLVVHPGDPPSLPAKLLGLQSFTIAPYPISLEAAQIGTALELAWSAADTNYVLESTASLSPGEWTVVEPAPSLEGARQVVGVEPTATSQFYRLRLR